jgi:hypothetical protein
MTTVRVTQEWEVERTRRPGLLDGPLIGIGLIVCLVYVAVGIGLVVVAWASSPVWCLLTLGWFCVHKLGRKRAGPP